MYSGSRGRGRGYREGWGPGTCSRSRKASLGPDACGSPLSGGVRKTWRAGWCFRGPNSECNEEFLSRSSEYYRGHPATITAGQWFRLGKGCPNESLQRVRNLTRFPKGMGILGARQSVTKRQTHSKIEQSGARSAPWKILGYLKSKRSVTHRKMKRSGARSAPGEFWGI